MLPNAALNVSMSFTFAPAALASAPNFSNRDLKSFVSCQTFGLAVYGSWAVGSSFEFGGNSAGAFDAVSAKVVQGLGSQGKLVSFEDTLQTMNSLPQKRPSRAYAA